MAQEPNPQEQNDEGEDAGDSGVRTGWIPRELLIPHILLAVSLQRAHGYLIEEYLRGLGFFSIEMSTLYRTLRQLEKDGLLGSAWEPGPSGPARRVYSLTDAGRRWLDAWTTPLRAYGNLIDRFFDVYERERPGEPGVGETANGEDADG